MAHERNVNDDSQDEGEYHFSDDQANYEIEPETTKPVGASKLAANFEQYKKPAIGLAVFFVLIFLVYKILAPSTSSTAPAVTDFSANNTAASQAAAKAKHGVEKSKIQKPIEESITVPTPPAAPQVAVSAAPQVATPTPAVVIAPEPTNPSSTTPTSAALPAAMNTAPIAGDANARMMSLEEQNAKMQADYTQKMAEMNTQVGALQGKLQDLNMRLASIETTLTRLSQGVREIKVNKPTNPQEVEIQTQRISGPKMTYTVQAIIPGRAWLKSDSGETVTVAEGDVLKDFGRIMKIDPYDGVVQVDINGKTVALSYGAGAE